MVRIHRSDRVHLFVASALSTIALLGYGFPLGWLNAQQTDQKNEVVVGEVEYRVPEGEERVAERFRLPAHRFSYRLERTGEVGNGIAVYELQFPSPFQSPVEANNTVHCEYFLPAQAQQKVPAVIVLHILGGDFPLARLFCLTFAERGVAALFLKMPYYGPRRPPGETRRMVSAQPEETVLGFTQAVLDIRRATSWLESRPELDGTRLGIFGISLGGITAALAAGCEPRLYNVCLVLAGGDIGRVTWDNPELRPVRQQWEARGGTREQYLELVGVIDPVRYAANVRGRRILMLNAAQDELIPRACTESLWNALGQPEIHWYDGGHYSVARYIVNAMKRTGDFFAASEARPAPQP
jgi:dienelactone hydrolase